MAISREASSSSSSFASGHRYQVFLSFRAAITALQKLTNNRNCKKELNKALERLGRVLCEADIRLLVETMLQKNGAEVAETELKRESKLLVKELEKNQREVGKEKRRMDLELQKEKSQCYFNYMGMLVVEGTYDKMEALLSQNIHPVDILLLMAASEGDLPKIEELLRAGADYTVKDKDGRTAVDIAVNDEVKNFILGYSVQNK